MSNPPPVIFIPGITASELKDEYPLDFERVWTLLRKDFLRVALHPNNLRYEALEPARITPDRVFQLVYGELIEELRHNLSPKPDRPTPVYGFPYDWRMPLEQTAATLSAFIDEVIARTQLLSHYHQDGYQDDPKINLVGHSMGGLLIAEYLARSNGQHRVSKVVSIGSPFRGSHEAVLKVTTGTAQIGTNTASSREREVARITPALYYLIPSFPGAVVADPGLSADLFQPEAWQPALLQSLKDYVRIYGLEPGSAQDQAEALFKGMLTAASAQRTRMEQLKLEDIGLSQDRWLAVVGVGEETRFRLHIADDRGKPWFDLTSQDRGSNWKPKDWRGKTETGDGTVPYKGAQMGFLSVDRLVCVCDDDFGYWEFADRTLEGVGVGLHATLPLMNLVQRLAVSHFLGRQFGEVWGRSAPDIGTADWNPPISKLRLKED